MRNRWDSKAFRVDVEDGVNILWNSETEHAALMAWI